MILTVVAAILAAQPTPDVLADGSCAANRLSAADRQSVLASVQGQASSPDVITRLLGHVDSCNSDSAVFGEAFVATIAYVVRDAKGRDLRARGVDPQLIDDLFDRQDAASKINSQPSEEQGREWGRQLVAAGAPEAVIHTHSTLVGEYMSTLIIIERLRRGLPAGQ